MMAMIMANDNAAKLQNVFLMNTAYWLCLSDIYLKLKWLKILRRKF